MKHILILSVVLFLFASSAYGAKKEIADLVNIPQSASSFSANIIQKMNLLDIQKNYKELYYSPWNMQKPEESIQEISWPFASYKVGESYGENLQLLKEDFFQEMRENYNFDEYLLVSRRAITLQYSNMRAFPTDKPLFKDPSKAGEGFPFDYLQNSSIAANKPIFVSHYSKDKKWVMVFSSFTFGWIKVGEIVFLDKSRTDRYQNAKQVFITKDNQAIYTQKGDFLFDSRVGMILPLISESKESYSVLVISNQARTVPTYLKVHIPKEIASKDTLHLNRNNFESIINEVSKGKYGWGGMYAQRDCSSMLRDMFLPFGIWLPRNSSHQSKVGEVINLESLSDREKIALIKAKAIPFETIFYRKGHVLLYLGNYENKLIVFHDAWGIRTKKDGIKGRIVVGKPIFTTLKFGSDQENYDASNEILRNLKSMNIVTRVSNLEGKE